MFGTKIRIDKELLKKAEKCAATAGYASVEEFFTHVVEKEIARMEEAEFEENAMKKLQGLGYIS
jgi:Arc/MetJ family transcription regulator